MSKYIKLEYAIEQVKTEFYGGGYQEWLEISIDNLINRIANLPTIEVSEDCISRANLFAELRRDAGRVEMEEFANDTVWRTIGNAPSVIPRVPSEDCISRDWVLNRLTKYQKDYTFNELDDWQNTVVEWITTDIENAPSVVSTTEQSSMVDIVTCEECKRCKKGLVIERRADEQETIVNLCNRTKPPTMVSLDFYCKDGERIEE